MPKLVKVYSDAQLVECPEKWAAHKGIMSECTIYESTTEPGKYWFYLIGDLGDSYTYFHCSPGEMKTDEMGHKLFFDTRSGSHYEVSVGEEKPADYQPAYVIGSGEGAVIVDPKVHSVAFRASDEVAEPVKVSDIPEMPAEQPVVETPIVETPVAEPAVVETPAVEVASVEAPVVEAPIVEAPIVEAPIVETPATEAPAIVEHPAVG